MEKDKIIKRVMTAAPVIPVVTVHDVGKAVELAKALVAGGLPSIEVTLRTPNAIEAIRAIADEVEGALAGAGTVLTSQQVRAVETAGADFMVSPGFAPDLLAAANDSPLPLLPGISSASEAMHLGELGYTCLKFFPAGPAGGPAYLKSIGAPLPQFSFCPTGGINSENASQYLELSNVLCVGGSWVAPSSLVNAGDWAAITKLASEAASLVG
ncbi:MAG: bifunctional 4-hydroxy-2-oxoglutarate aldolase/2-dehydro-3-deoxy-phosphogluconate aldolase [Hyphomicrobiales bacterium]|nr:bifunctional 4-hydroxy-2-oxoglutarate aldolase/2-dehydro-3-deoxy-phosphogluconate aldolase [Hyphomicrobiales bacterium]